MPMNWNADTEAKLIAAIFQVCEVKINTNELKQIAEIMGNGNYHFSFVFWLWWKWKQQQQEWEAGREQKEGNGMRKTQRLQLTSPRGCTPKALTHRISKLRSTKLRSGGDGDGDSAVDVPAPAPKKKATPKKKKKTTTVKTEPNNEDEEESLPSPPKTVSKKRTSQGKMKNDSGEILLDDREIHVGEDVGEGFRKKRFLGETEEGEDEDDGLI